MTWDFMLKALTAELKKPDFNKVKNFCASRKCKDNPLTRRKYLQIVYDKCLISRINSKSLQQKEKQSN